MLTGDPKKRCTIEDLREDNWVNLGEKGPPLQVKPFLNSNETKPLIKRIVGVQVSPTGTSYTLHQVNDPRKLDASKTSRLTPVPRKNMSPLESCDQLGAISPISKARTASQNTADAPGEIINDANDYSGGLVLRKAIAKQTLRGRTVSSSVQTTNSKTVVSFRPRASSAGVARTQNILNRMSSQAFVSRLKTNSSAASLKISKQKENVSSNGSSGAPCPPYSQLDTNKRTKVFKSASFALDKHGNQKNNTNEPSPTNPVRNSIGNKSLGPDSLDPFSLQDEEEQCNPTVEEIESWHLFHRPAKKIRILKFAFNPATISSLSAPVIFQEMYKSLVHLQQEKYHGLVFKRDSDLYLISGRLMSKTFSLSSSSSVAVSKTTPSSSVSDETCRLQFEVEVCKVWMLNLLHAVRFKRIAGDPFLCKDFYSNFIAFSSVNKK